MVQSQNALTLAQSLVTDHQANEQEVTQLATKKGIVLYPVQPTNVEVAQDNFLSKQTGASYDQVFLLIQKQSHQDSVNRLQGLSSEVTDPDIKDLVNQTLTIEQKHLGLAGGTAPQPSPSPTASASPSPSPSVSPSVSPSPGPSGASGTSGASGASGSSGASGASGSSGVYPFPR
jgi:hypothetical protein